MSPFPQIFAGTHKKPPGTTAFRRRCTAPQAHVEGAQISKAIQRHSTAAAAAQPRTSLSVCLCVSPSCYGRASESGPCSAWTSCPCVYPHAASLHPCHPDKNPKHEHATTVSIHRNPDRFRSRGNWPRAGHDNAQTVTGGCVCPCVQYNLAYKDAPVLIPLAANKK